MTRSRRKSWRSAARGGFPTITLSTARALSAKSIRDARRLKPLTSSCASTAPTRAQSETRVALFLEKDALAGTLEELCDRYAVPLYATRGFSSETFAFEAVRACAKRKKDLIAYSLYDFDRSGQDAAKWLRIHALPVC